MAAFTSTAQSPDLDLSYLCQTPVFTSQAPLHSHQLLSRELVEHDLLWRGDGVDTALFRRYLGRCQVYALRYGAEVEVRLRPFSDFVLVQMLLNGRARVDCDGVSLELEAGQVVVLSRCQAARLVWQRGCEQLMLRVPRSLLEQGRQQVLDAGGVDQPLPSAYCLDPMQTRVWMRLVGNVLDQMALHGEQASPEPWVQHLEHSLALFLLTHPPRGLAPRLPDPESAGQRQALRQLAKIETLMRQRLGEALTLAELAAVGGMSVRSLNSLCQRCYRQTPMERLRALRLEAARERLLARRDLSITEVALAHGFAHLGRFAHYYHQRFGELPHHTRSR